MMADEKTFTIAQAHYQFAVDFHRQTWELLEKKDRSRFEDVRMLDYAHASLAHWRTAGRAARHQRGEWLVSRVHAVLGDGVQALKHAQLCYELLEGNKDEMQDFDFAFAYEAIARAYAVNGEKTEAMKFLERAQKAGEAIQEQEEREVFFTELNGGEWNGVK
jgi:tetratricopeptide (TPR) repeat protein